MITSEQSLNLSKDISEDRIERELIYLEDKIKEASHKGQTSISFITADDNVLKELIQQLIKSGYSVKPSVLLSNLRSGAYINISWGEE